MVAFARRWPVDTLRASLFLEHDYGRLTVSTRLSRRRSGWNRFDTSASPFYTNDQTQRERETYRDRVAA